MSAYERKVQLIVGVSLKRFNGVWTQEQYQQEVVVARNILNVLGVNP